MQVVIGMFLLLTYSEVDASVSDNVYCRHHCNGSKSQLHSEHVCCKYAPCGPGPKCSLPYERYETKDGDKQLLLDLHNEFRNRIASGEDTLLPTPAANMQVLTYDKELEFISACWASRCSSEGERCMDSIKGRTNHILWESTENRYFRASARIYLLKSLAHYYQHLKHLTPNLIVNFNASGASQEVVSLSQVLWATTRYFGCTRVSFRSSLNIFRTYHLVCAYFPAGNVQSETVYEPGYPCTRCARGLSCNHNYKALCGQVEFSFGEDRFIPPFRLCAASVTMQLYLPIIEIIVLLCDRRCWI